MRTTVGIDALEPPAGTGSVVTIGTFDGVHLGHRGLIMQAIEEAEERGAQSVAVTWDRHPAETLRPDKAPALLTTPDRKIELLGETGIDMTAVLPFDKEFSQLSPEGFVEQVLVAGLAAVSVYVGRDWRFGHRAAGTVELLTEMGKQHGFSVNGVDLQTISDEAVSSSRVRRAIADGEMELARVLLGRPFDVDGRVVRGAARGKDLGFPTANLEVDPKIARPPLGVYAGLARVSGLAKPAAISVGVNPTFGGKEGVSPVSIEAYILDFEAEIYDETVRLEFWARLRDEINFASVDDLIAQMGRDVEETRKVLGA